MRFTREMEQEIILALRNDNDTCIVLPDEAYRDDGNILIHRDNISQFLHRYLYRKLIDPKLGRSRFLLQTCTTPGCMNPYHRNKSPQPGRLRQATHCPNNHEYTPENTLPEGRDRCRTCRDARRARRGIGTNGPSVAELNSAKTHCPHGHKYTEDNTYYSKTPNGGYRRKCRTCTIDRTRAARNNQKSEN